MDISTATMWRACGPLTCEGASHGSPAKTQMPTPQPPDMPQAKTLSRDISDETAAVIDGWRITHLTQDPFGQIATAELHITAPVLTAVLDYHSASSDYYLRGPHDTGVPVQGQEHTYRRVGHIWELGMSHFQALERQSIVLI
ncbi:unnamed protein product [Aspergillus oryzae RIB40]|uniref:DNA, SC003 n=1 Tax=Aspergillus oryzae (strain ATCC 42149 / RIB 40) TaxID=510516 RepID=Q2UM72_ASPOR|nr:unnamed protein product [Aspergillus oryzae RIB40]BAE57343.1 unnamed protein product [Aspergillus oryzae RIB40]